MKRLVLKSSNGCGKNSHGRYAFMPAMINSFGSLRIPHIYSYIQNDRSALKHEITNPHDNRKNANWSVHDILALIDDTARPMNWYPANENP